MSTSKTTSGADEAPSTLTPDTAPDPDSPVAQTPAEGASETVAAVALVAAGGPGARQTDADPVKPGRSAKPYVIAGFNEPDPDSKVGGELRWEVGDHYTGKNTKDHLKPGRHRGPRVALLDEPPARVDTTGGN